MNRESELPSWRVEPVAASFQPFWNLEELIRRQQSLPQTSPSEDLSPSKGLTQTKLRKEEQDRHSIIQNTYGLNTKWLLYIWIYVIYVHISSQAFATDL